MNIDSVTTITPVPFDQNGQRLPMIPQELLRELAEPYLKALISQASESLHPDFDSFAPFGELGINSFHVLKIIKRLEVDFGRLPKSLLFEYFTVNDLVDYFVVKHGETLSARFADELQSAHPLAPANGRQREVVKMTQAAKPSAEGRADGNTPGPGPVRILEAEAYAHPEYQHLVHTLFERYKSEGCVSRGTRKIAPNLFIGSARRGYFNYSRSKNIILVYGYVGPREYVPALLEEIYRYCVSKSFQLNLVAAEEILSICDTSFSATPFGVLQRIVNLKGFTLEGGAKRHLRYQVAKFQKAGTCKTEEYKCGSNPDKDKSIVAVIDRWCESRTMVNPLVHDVRKEILAGTLGPGHRLFLTYNDDVLQNVILITAMSSEENGYLMDLEFYPPEMSRGGLEFAIVQIIDLLAAEGCDVLSLGGTYGCKLKPSSHADPEIDKILDDLREQNVVNDEGNLQFKNKFRPEDKTIFLCRPVENSDPDNVIDVIMMIADPVKMQTSEEENHNFSKASVSIVAAVGEPPVRRATFPEVAGTGCEPLKIEGDERRRILSEFGFNPLNIPHEHVEFDLKTDSWAQLRMPWIEAQMSHLQAQLQQPMSVDESVRVVFPFAHCVLTSSGEAAENIFFRAWSKKGVVPQNLLFPSTIFHQIDKGFTNAEMPHPAVFDLNSHEPYKGNLDWEALQARVAQSPDTIAMVCIELGNNGAGGYPVSMRHLRDVKALLTRHSLPLVLDVTRVVENAQFLIEQETEYAGKSIWAVVREIVSCADAVIGSLTKEFCVNRGGIIATNDIQLFRRLQELAHEEGAGIDLIDEKIIALSLQSRQKLEAKVLRRMHGVRLMWGALNERGIPVAQPCGGHCVLIDVKQISEFKDFKYPVASFLAWMYLNTGIRASAHSVGMQTQTSINQLVRIAIPVGLKRDQIDAAIERLIHAFAKKVNIPEVVMVSGATRSFGSVYADYQLVKYHNASGRIAAGTTSAIVASVRNVADEHASAFAVPPAAALTPNVSRREGTKEASSQVVLNVEPPQTQDIAVVGMAGRYPKAKNLRELWENVKQGKDCIEDIPEDRYLRRPHRGNIEKYRGGFIDDVDRFDSLFFNISPLEAEMLDPQERLFLEVAWEAVEDAGYYPESLGLEDGSRNIGVFVGAVWTMYQMLGVEDKSAGSKLKPNSFLWSIANRVSYWMNLSGPSLTLDTACSSSLTAIYLACEAIHAGQCSAALVGGVNLDLHQAKLDINIAGGALSPAGVCHSFGKGADGYVAGEGIGALFLKPLDQAIQDGDNIYGVIKSAVINHGGRTSGYTVPNPKAQANLIVAALEKANIDARSIGYIEAHGTGTVLGDPIEITGLSSAFKSYSVQNQTCAIGSIKSNIGHLEAAAGIVSVSKVLLQMKHRQLAPSLHSSELNEFIDFENSPFYVVQKLEDWKARELDGLRFPLRAGISSFGAGGANAHLVLENYEPIVQSRKKSAQPCELVFPLSARDEDQLREAAMRLAKFVQQDHEALTDIAHTLQIGRKSFDHRLAIVGKGKEEVVEKLFCFLAAKKAEGIVAGHVKGAETLTRLLGRTEKQEFIRLLSQRRDPQKLAELWVEGLLPDWQGLQADDSAKRVSLPTYPFADKRHWAYQKSATLPSSQPAAGMHPLVDSNESTFEHQVFRKTFNQQDFFIYDHLVSNIPTLPGVAYLELARKAGEIAGGRKVQKLRQVLWLSPIAVQDSIPKEVFIELIPSDTKVRFEVFSKDKQGDKMLHSQGTLQYATMEEASAEPEYIDLESVRARCAKIIDGKNVYPLFKSFGLTLGPSFQVLQEIRKNENEILGALKLPECRLGELLSMVLHPSLLDGSLQAGMGAQLGENVGQMFVPFSIGEVEILHPLQTNCFSYVTQAKEDRPGKAENVRILKSNVLILDEAGKVLVKIRESTGVPLRELYKKQPKTADAEGFSRLYFSYDWEQAPAAVEAKQTSQNSIVLFDTAETFRDLYKARLEETGVTTDQVILVRPGSGFQDLGEQSYRIDPQNKNDFTRLFATLVEKGCAVENICFAWPLSYADCLDEKGLKEFLGLVVNPFLFVCQALIQHRLESKAQLVYLYSTKQGETQPHNEAAGGFIKTLRAEHPKLLSKTLEVRQENVSFDHIIDAVSKEFQAHTQDATAVRYETQLRYVRKLNAFDFAEDEDPSSLPAMVLRQKGVYLITGGAGGLGLLFAEYLAKNCNARLVLIGRSNLSLEQEAKIEQLRMSGSEIIYLRSDVSNREDVETLVSESKARFGEINGVIHAAGVLRDSNIRNKKPEEMNAVFAPKVFGTLYLDEATKDEDLDFFVTFSSLSAVAGSVGQCDYSYANHFMDSFAAGRELLRAKGARSGKTLSLNWSLWADGGMKVDEGTELYFKKSLGIKPISVSTGFEAFMKGLASKRSQFAVLEGVQEKVELAWGLRKRVATVSAPAPSHQPVAASPAKPMAADAAAAILAKNRTADADPPLSADGSGQMSKGNIQQIITAKLSEALQMDTASIGDDAPFADYGVNSIIGVNLVRMVSETLGLELDPIILFEYSTVNELTEYIFTTCQGQLTEQQDQANNMPRSLGNVMDRTPVGQEGGVDHRFARKPPLAATAGAVSVHRESNSRDIFLEPIAIIGMSGRFGESESMDEFWQNLKEGRDLVKEVTRWDREDCASAESAGQGYCSRGSFVESIDRFDPTFFGISALEAVWMDPQQRLFLEESWRALEDAGYAGKSVHEKQCGVYVGCGSSSYDRLFVGEPPPQAFWGNAVSVIPARIAYYLNLQGPAIAVDTASSSSLVAIHLACQGLWSGEMEMALAGGVFLQTTPGFYQVTNRAGMLSPDGKCYTFDARANGFVPGEAVGVVVLKRLREALQDGDYVHGVIAGSGINQDGSSNGLIAPNARAQERLARSVYDRFKINPETIQVVEANGTGTILGDSIEYQAVSRAFREYTAKNQYCAIGSVATNLGHAASAAGVAGVLKVLLSLKHRQIPPSLHFETGNPAIAFDSSPFYVNTEFREWSVDSDQPRRAAISSFGIGGTNAHLVIEEGPPIERSSIQSPAYVVVLSARTGLQVKQQVRNLLAVLVERPDLSMNDLSFSLFVGRMHLNHRLSCLARNQTELIRLLEQWLETGSASQVFTSEIHESKKRENPSLVRFGNYCIHECSDSPESANCLDHLSTVADLYVQGYSLDFPALFSPGSKRMPLPTYPFAEERYWIGAAITASPDPRQLQRDADPDLFAADRVSESSTLVIA